MYGRDQQGDDKDCRESGRMTPGSRKTSLPPVPKAMLPIYEAVVAQTDAFCLEHLNAGYRDLACRMAAAPCRKCPSAMTSGQPRTWACATFHVLDDTNPSQVSFLLVEAGLVLMPQAGSAAASQRAIDPERMRQPAAALSGSACRRSETRRRPDRQTGAPRYINSMSRRFARALPSM